MSFNMNLKAEVGDLRLSSIKLGQAEIQTPYCGLIHTDLERLTEGSNILKTAIPKKQLHEIIIDFNNQDILDSRLESEEGRQQTIKKMISLSKNDQENICQFRLNPQLNLSTVQLCNIVAMQSYTEKYSVITIPDPIREMSKNWTNRMESALDEAKDAIDTGGGFVIMPTVSLEQPQKFVEAKVDWLLKKDILSIGLRAHGTYFPRRLYAATEIVKQHEAPIWIHLYDLYKRFIDLSQIHLAPLASVDTISPKKGYASREKTSDEDKGDFATPVGVRMDLTEKEKKGKRFVPQKDFFETKALGFFTEKERIERLGYEVFCECPLCRQIEGWTEFIDYLERPEKKSLLQVHESHGFNSELNIMQQDIIENDLATYFNTKILINERIDRILRRYPTIANI